MKTSIALCTYNGAKFLNEQLESFLNQTQLPDELIICDDFSTDSTVEIIKEFAKNSPFPVRIEINKETLGVIKNFEKAIALCNGEIIFLSDQDDIWIPEKIREISREFEQNNNLGLVFTDAELIGNNFRKSNKTLFDYCFKKSDRNKPLFDICLNRNVVTGATMAFRTLYREWFMPIPTDISNLIHDAWIALVISTEAEYKFLEKPLIKYRQHTEQQLGLVRKSYQSSISRLEEEIFVLSHLSQIITNEKVLKTLKTKSHLIDNLIFEKSDQIKHFETRMSLSKNRLKRILPVLSEATTGRYSKFSGGFKSIAKDIFGKN